MKLHFRPAALTAVENDEGKTAYEATAEGVIYRVIGAIVDPMVGPRRTFRAFRKAGARLVPAADGGEHRTRAAAFAQAESDLVDVLRERAAERQLDQLRQAERDLDPADAPPPEAELLAEGDRLSMVITPSGMRKIEAHLAKRQQPAPADPATDDSNELLDRIVRRAQYTALCELLAQLDGWIASVRSNCEASGHAHATEADGCSNNFAPSDIRLMAQDAAMALGLPKLAEQ